MAADLKESGLDVSDIASQTKAAALAVLRSFGSHDSTVRASDIRKALRESNGARNGLAVHLTNAVVGSFPCSNQIHS